MTTWSDIRYAINMMRDDLPGESSLDHSMYVEPIVIEAAHNAVDLFEAAGFPVGKIFATDQEQIVFTWETNGRKMYIGTTAASLEDAIILHNEQSQVEFLKKEVERLKEFEWMYEDLCK